MGAGLIEAEGLAIGYQRGKTALASGLDAALAAGEFVCLLGPNGAGKSTLIRTITGLQPALAGSVRIAGEDLRGIPARRLARHLGLVLTDRIQPGLLTVRELVSLGRYSFSDWLGNLGEHDRLVVSRVLESAGVSGLSERPVAELSDGERQKVMIARALAQEPLVLVLDEPTAFLDLPRRVEIMRLLRRTAHAGGHAVLCSTHELDLALRSADRIWLLPHGGPLFTGTPAELVGQGLFEKVFGIGGLSFNRETGTFVFPHEGEEAKEAAE